MDKCTAYITSNGKPECLGTKEREVCSYGGDKSKCDFYPEKRRNADMDKPLKDWLFLEAQSFAAGVTNCKDCAFGIDGRYPRFCEQNFKRCPAKWDLSDPPRWTEQEWEDAKMLLRMFNGVYAYVHRYVSGLCMMVKEDSVAEIPLEPTLFPSLQSGETVNLSEIAGCEE